MTYSDNLRGTGTTSDQNVGEAALTGGRWLPIAQMVNQVSRIASSIILAWFLTREEFGLVAVAMVVLALVDRLADLGTGQALIQRKILDERLADAIFALNTSIGLVLGLGIIVFADPLATLAGGEGAEAAANLMRVLGLNVIIKSFGVVQFALLRRRLQFVKAALSIVASTVVYFVLTVVLAANGAGAWSLVIGTTVASLASVTLTTIWSGWLPRFRFDLEAIRSVARFSLGLTGTNLFNYATQNVDRSLIAHNLGVAALGVYALGVRTLRSPIILITKTINQVLVPVLSRLQDDLAGQRRHFLAASSTAALVVFPSMVGLAILADPLVDAVLPERWSEAAPLIQVMAPIGMVRSLWGLMSPIFVANAKTGRQFIWSVFFGVLLIISYLITARISIIAVVFGIGIVHVLASPIFFYISFNIIELTMARYLRAIVPAAFVTGAMAGAVALSKSALTAGDHGPWTQLGVCVPVGVVVYVALVLITRPAGLEPLLRIINARVTPRLQRT